jgi:eukaryotic-like serine/threonine-protein kinase
MSHEPFAAAPTLPPEAAQPPDEPWAGHIVAGRYRLIRKLGEGGMGAVFLAEHLKLQKQVALKTIHAGIAGQAEVAARFAREAMASARIEHPHVVSAIDFGTLDDGSAFLVMQLARGEGLRERMVREGAMPFALASLIIEQMADALAAAHAAGIVHRDLKPENVVLEPTDGAPVHVRVLDFGIAHLRSDAEPAQAPTGGAPLTRLGVVMGTPGYMAPEQALGQPVDERTDLYALGVMLWELCAGRPPFEGESLTAIVTQQLAGSPPALPAGLPGVPAQLGGLLASLLSPQPEGRPASATELRDRLRALRTAPRAARSPKPLVPTRIAKQCAAAAAVLVVALALALVARRSAPAAQEAPTEAAAVRAASPEPQTAPEPVRESAGRPQPAAAPAASAPEPATARPEPAPTRRSKGRTRRESIGSRVRRTVDSIFR